MLTTAELLALPVHPAAEMFPLMNDDELKELADDIREHGLNQPIYLYRDPELGVSVLDGRNRIRACDLSSTEVSVRYYTGDDPIDFAISENLKRRHLTLGQRSFIALKIEPLFADEAARLNTEKAAEQPREHGRFASSQVTPPRGDPPSTVPDESKRPRERAAKTTGVTGRNVSQAKRIEKEAPELVAGVQSGALPLDRAERIVKARAKGQAEPSVKRAGPKRRALPDVARDAGYALRKDVEKIERIYADDRYREHKRAVDRFLNGHLDYAIETLTRLRNGDENGEHTP